MLNAAHLSLASGELDVHETAGVLEPLHGTALTTQLSALIQLQRSMQHGVAIEFGEGLVRRSTVHRLHRVVGI